MPLDDLPVHIRANGLRRRREALGLTSTEVAAGCGLLVFSVEKAEQGLEDAATYRLLEDWLDARELETATQEGKTVPRPRGIRQPLTQQQQLAPRSQPCEFELSVDGITITARGPADKIDAMGAIIRDAFAALTQHQGEAPPVRSHARQSR